MFSRFVAVVAVIILLAGVSLLADETKTLIGIVESLPQAFRITAPVVVLDPAQYFTNLSKVSADVRRSLLESPTYTMEIQGRLSIVVNWRSAFVQSALTGRNEFHRAALASLLVHEQCHADGKANCYEVQLAVWQELRRTGALLQVSRSDSDNWERDIQSLAQREKKGEKIHALPVVSTISLSAK